MGGPTTAVAPATHAASAASATGTTASRPPTAPKATRPSADGTPPEWVNDSLQPLSGVSNVAGVPVLVAHEGSDVHALGLDPDDGSIRWRRPLGTSGVVPGIAVHFGVLQERYVAYFEPLPSGTYARLVILDPRGEGKEVARSATMRFSSYPSPCDDDERFICAEASEGNGSATYRLRPGMDALEQSGETHGFIQSIGPAGLVRFTDAKADQHRVGVQGDGKTVWSKPGRELFGPRHTTDGGWSFDADAERDLVYGTVGPVVEVGDTIALKEARLLIGFDSRTGAVRWQHRGLDSFCDADFTRGSRTDPFIVCEWTGGTATVGERAKTDRCLRRDAAR